MNKEHSVAFCRLLGFGAWALLMAACGDVSVDSPDTSGVNYASADAIGAHEPEGAQDAHGASESGEGEDALSEAAGELGPGTSPHDVMPSGGEERPDAERIGEGPDAEPIGEGPDAEPIGEGPDAALESALGPTRYDPGELHSPLTPFVVENLRSIAAIDDSLHDDVFAKIGASSMASTNTLACFAGSEVDAGLMPPASVDTWELFLEGDAGGEDPFSRTSLAALSGKTAAWAIDGASSPLISEVEAIHPRFGLVEYGTNDMGMGSTYGSAMTGFADALVSLVDALIMRGIIPVLHTNRARLDSPGANQWVETYNTVIRGIAQGRQIPLFDQFLLLEGLSDFGLGSDGLHMSVYKDGGVSQACRFHDEALGYGYNTRNLATIEALTRLTAVITDGLDAPDTAPVAAQGLGTLGSPFLVDALPYSAMRNTEESTQSYLDQYSGCAADQDESGPEHIYRLSLDEPKRLRAMVLDQGEVDIDLHLLNETATVEGCMARHDRLWEGTLGAGTYYFSLDTYVSQGEPRPGEYLFVLVECHPDDVACD